MSAAASALVAPALACHDRPITIAAAASQPLPVSSARGDSTMIAQILEANRHYDAQYRNGPSNHLSMAVLALHDLGASDARLSDFFARYRRRLEPIPARSDAITRDTWREHTGTHRRYADYLAFFEGEVAHGGGADAAVRAYLPALMPGVSGAGFHALIRLAYAVHAHDDSDVAASLAYFADTYLPLGEPTPGATPRGGAPSDLLRRIAETPALAKRSFSDGLIFDRLRSTAAMPEFGQVTSDALGSTEVSLASLADVAATLYASTENFTALHAVTATHALRVLSPLIEDRAAAHRYLLQAFGAVYVSIGAPALLPDAERARAEAVEVPSWEAIASAAIAADDEHVIKLVYTCREESTAYARPIYRVIAAKKARLA